MPRAASAPTRGGRLAHALTCHCPLALALALALALGPATGTGSASETEKLSYAERGYTILDPAGAARPNDERLVVALFDPLTALDPLTGRAVGAAATRWEEASDGLSWTFHLDPKGTWTDKSPVKASDFVAAWRRVVDPYEPYPLASLFRPLKGCATIADGDRAMRSLSAAYKGIRALASTNAGGVPGRELRDLLERTGVRPLVKDLGDSNVKRMLRWGDDPFPTAKAEAVVDVLKKERRRIKSAVYGAYDEFGKTMGATAKDDHTLVVFVEGRTPYLPQLVSRSAFVPLHVRTIKGGEKAFEPSEIISNGPFRLHGRGPKPRPGVPDPDSVVHLRKRADYQGRLPAGLEEIMCYTGQGAEEDLRRLRKGELQWMADVSADVREDVEKLSGYGIRPTARLLLLRFRVDRPPFDDVRLRRALALTLDRARLAKRLWPTAVEAERVVPPTVTGAQPGIAMKKGSAAEAKKLLKEAGLEGEDFPWIELHFEERPELDELAERLIQGWEKALGVELGLRIDTPADAAKVRAAGAFSVGLGEIDGSVDDPAGWVARFAADHPDSGLGWKDEGFEALLAAAADVDAFLEAGEERLAALPDASALRPKVAGARGSSRGKDALRLALLAAAERRLLDECVVVPLLRAQRAEVMQGVRSLGADRVWRHPGFVGSLRSARR